LFNALIFVLFSAVSGKECKSDTDCVGIANTTCMRHPEDTKMRCLCGEKKSPQNGACHHSKQGKQKCHVLVCRDILVECIYFYFYENSSRFKHVTYDQAGGARDFFEKPTVNLLVNIHPGFSEVASFNLQVE